MKALKEGQKAPDFTLEDKDGKEYTLSEIDSDYVVLYFYPKDDTPGCTIEAQGFSAHVDAFSKAGATIIGISGGNRKSKENFCSRYDLKVTLLSDSDFSVSQEYDSYGKKKFMGREYMGIMRNTFVLDKDKKILKVYEGVKPKEHPQEVLAFLKEQ